ncbi:hypothetical protein P885DRAFT_63526 [Corynascus similis CBS 632.67]
MARPEGNAAELGQPADQPRGSLFGSLSDQFKSFAFRMSKDSSASLFGQPKSYPSAEPTDPSASMFSHSKNTLFGPGASVPLFGQPKSPAEGTLSIVIQPAGIPAKELRISVEGPGGHAHHASSEPPASQDSSLRTQVRVVVGWGSSATVEFGLPPHSPPS